MKKWIRWQGLVGFVSVILIIAIFWFFLLDMLVRRGIEAAGTRLAGAKVELAQADVSLFPLGMTLAGLRVTDKEAPMTNAVEVSRISFTVDGLNILRRKVIIEKMAAEGFQFGTPRKTSGAVSRPEKKPSASKSTSFQLPSFEKPDVKKILKDEELDSLQQIESARTDIRNMGSTWKKVGDGLPDKKHIDDYKARIEKLKKAKPADLRQQLAETAAVKKDIERDLDTIRKAKETFNADLASAKIAIAKAEKAPQEDVRRIMDKYGMSSAGLQNMSKVLFGDKINTWVRRGVLWYGRLQPMLARPREKKGTAGAAKPARGKGVDVRFKEYRPLPDFLIRTVNASLLPKAGIFSGKIRNITPDQDVLGAPMTLAFSGEGMQEVRSAKLNGVFNHVRPSKPDDRMTLVVQGYRAMDAVLSENEKLPVSLKEGLVDLKVDGVSRGENFSAKVTAMVRSVRFSSGGKENANPYARAMSSALSKVSSFTLSADVAGTFEDYSVRISSNLDRVLQDAVGKLVREQAGKLEKELQAAIAGKTGGALSDLKKNYSALEATGGSLTGRQNQLNDLLKNAVKSGLPEKLKLPFR